MPPQWSVGFLVGDDAGAAFPAAAFEGHMQFEADSTVEGVDAEDVADLC